MVIVVVWGFSTIIINVDVIVIISIVPLFRLWNVCPMQVHDNIPPWAFCHNLFSEMLSFDIHNAIINVQSTILLNC